jgi:hypothetical protein
MSAAHTHEKARVLRAIRKNAEQEASGWMQHESSYTLSVLLKMAKRDGYIREALAIIDEIRDRSAP